jgi:hypothetical protein
MALSITQLINFTLIKKHFYMKKIYLLAGVVLGGMLHTTNVAAQAASVVLIPFSGTSVTYPSITSAYAAIPASPTMNYTIELLPTYAGTDPSEVYPIQFTHKGVTPGGAITITIRPSVANNGETIQRPTPAAGPVLQFNGADNVILDGRPGGIASTPANYLTINDLFSGSATNRNIEILNAANNNTIQYINATAADANAAGAGSRVILVGSTTTTANSNNTIQNCIVTGGVRGIQDFGLSDAVPNSGTKILNNTVRNFGAIGIFGGTGQSNITITGNTVSMASYNLLTAGAIVGIQQQSLVAGTTAITDNTISLVISSNAATTLTGIVDLAVGTENILRNTISTLSSPSASTQNLGIGVYSNGTTTFNVANNTISNLVSPAATALIGIVCGNGTTPGPTTANINDNNISGFTGVGATSMTGLSLGTSAASTFTASGNIIQGFTGTAATSVIGVTAGNTSVSTFTFTKNRISDLSSSAAVNIRGYSIFPFTGSTVNVNNNFVSITQPNTTATAIFGMLFGNTLGSNYTANIYYNSVRIGGTHTTGTTASISGSGIYRADDNATSVFNIKNNIALMERSSSSPALMVGFFNGSASGTLAIDYNNWFAPVGTTNGFAAGWVSTLYNDPVTYKTAATPQEQNTTFSAVNFVSNTDLHLTGTSITDPTLKATPVAGITTDIDGNTRSATAPTKGADEPGLPFPVQLMTFSGAAKGTYNQLSWITASETNNNGFELQRSTDGKDFRAINFIKTKSANGNSTDRLSYGFDDMKPFATSSYYRLKQVDKDGHFVYSGIVLLKGKGVLGVEISNLYPNPVKDAFNVVISTAKEGRVSIIVTDASCRNVMSSNVDVKAGDNIIPLQGSALNAGLYMVRIVHQGTKETANIQFIK